NPSWKRQYVAGSAWNKAKATAGRRAINSVWTQQANVSPRTQAVPEAQLRALVPTLLGLAAFVSPPSETSPDNKDRWRQAVSSGRFPAIAGEHGCILSSGSLFPRAAGRVQDHPPMSCAP